MNAPVLIVGACPVGLALAIMLRRHGVDLRIIDRDSGPAPESRSLAVHARTLEVLGPDLAAELVAAGQPIRTISVRRRPSEGRRELGSMHLEGSPTPFSFALALGQNSVERILVAELERLGVTVEWNTEFTSLDDPLAVDAPFVIGCDGVESSVRAAAGIRIDGARDDRWWLLADITVSGVDVAARDTAVAVLEGGELLAMFPLDAGAAGSTRVDREPDESEDLRRVIVAGQSRGERPEVTAEVVQAALTRMVGVGIHLDCARWFSAFRVREHVAERFRAGRILLAGDAAHTHSPLGAQGMNLGIQDAANLAWKLALVTRGAADDALLDSFEAERRPVAQQTVAATGRGTRAARSANPIIGALRSFVLRRALHSPRARRLVRSNLQMLTVGYRRSPLVVRSRGHALRPGDRVPITDDTLHRMLHSPLHTALAIAAPDSPSLVPLSAALSGLPARLVAVPEAPAGIDAAPGDLLVIRPDGYLAARGTLSDAPRLISDWAAANRVRATAPPTR